MNSKHRIRYTLRGIPRGLDEAVRRKAKQEGTSLNETVIELLKLGVGLKGGRILHHDLDDLAGKWVHDPVVDAVIEDQRAIDPEMWE
jgi:hypothetical protein